MRKISKVLFVCIVLFASVGYTPSAKEGKQPTDVFLKRSGIWGGQFANFVNKEGGVIQRGRILMKMVVDSNGIINQSIAIIRTDGTKSDYQGYATMKVEGNKLRWIGPVTKDENTGNPIEEHAFEGYIGWDQIYFVETYKEIFPDSRREKRKNNIHLVVLGEKKVLWLADIHVDGKLLVFSNTVLEWQN